MQFVSPLHHGRTRPYLQSFAITVSPSDSLRDNTSSLPFTDWEIEAKGKAEIVDQDFSNSQVSVSFLPLHFFKLLHPSLTATARNDLSSQLL